MIDYREALELEQYHDTLIRDALHEREQDMPSYLHSKLLEDGGYTYSTVTHEQAHSGKAVSIFPQYEMSFPLATFTEEHISAYYDMVQHELSDARVHLGGWIDYESGLVYLDLSVIVPTHEQASQLASEYHQLAYFNLDSMEEIRI